MSLSYEWSITSLKKQDVTNAPNFIIEVGWKLKGTDSDDVFGEYNSVCRFDVKEVDNTFVPYENLTEEILVNWVKDIVLVSGTESSYTYYDSIISSIEYQISQKKLNVQMVNQTELPWVPPVREEDSYIHVEMPPPSNEE